MLELQKPTVNENEFLIYFIDRSHEGGGCEVTDINKQKK